MTAAFTGEVHPVADLFPMLADDEATPAATPEAVMFSPRPVPCPRLPRPRPGRTPRRRPAALHSTQASAVPAPTARGAGAST